MPHSFLLTTGRWSIEGTWVERNQPPTIIKGATSVTWQEDNWFNITTRLIFLEKESSDIMYQYSCHFYGDPHNKYSFVLKHSSLGRIEGEGWLGENSIIQRYWLMGDEQRRSGFDSFYQISQDTYHLSGGVFTGHHLANTIDALMHRQA